MGAFDDAFAQLVRGVDASWLLTRRMLERPAVWAGTSGVWFGSAILFAEPGLGVGGVAAAAVSGVLRARQDGQRQQADFDYRDMLDAYQDRLDDIAEQTDADVAANLVRTRARHARQHADWDAKLRAAEGLPALEEPKRPKLVPIRREMVGADGDVHVLHGFADAALPQLQQELSWQQSNLQAAARQVTRSAILDLLEHYQQSSFAASRTRQTVAAIMDELKAEDAAAAQGIRRGVGGVVPDAAMSVARDIAEQRLRNALAEDARVQLLDDQLRERMRARRQVNPWPVAPPYEATDL